MPNRERPPLVPQWVVIFIALVVTLGWLATVFAALRNPANAGSLITVSGLLTMVIGALFGLADKIQVKKRREETEKAEEEAK